jgi:hypothetical protein
MYAGSERTQQILCSRTCTFDYAAEPALSIMQQNLHFRLCSRTCTFDYAAEPALSPMQQNLHFRMYRLA